MPGGFFITDGGDWLMAYQFAKAIINGQSNAGRDEKGAQEQARKHLSGQTRALRFGPVRFCQTVQSIYGRP